MTSHMLTHLLIASFILAATSTAAPAADPESASVSPTANAPANTAATPSAPSAATVPPSPAAAPATGGGSGTAPKAPSSGGAKAPANGNGKIPSKGSAKGRNHASGTATPGGASARAQNGASGHAPGEIAVARFSASDLSGWTDKSHKGKTSYALEEGVLKAHAVKAGSGKIKKVSVDTRKYPLLSWSWKIDHTLKREDIRQKSGDDFAARIYVIFPRTFFWTMRAINYVWAAKMPKGSEAPSPYTKNSVIIAVESGEDKAGKWVTEERNIYEDYKRIFGEEPPLLGGVAIMTDTDDTEDEATAWYGDISLRAY